MRVDFDQCILSAVVRCLQTDAWNSAPGFVLVPQSVNVPPRASGDFTPGGHGLAPACLRAVALASTGAANNALLASAAARSLCLRSIHRPLAASRRFILYFKEVCCRLIIAPFAAQKQTGRPAGLPATDPISASAFRPALRCCGSRGQDRPAGARLLYVFRLVISYHDPYDLPRWPDRHLCPVQAGWLTFSRPVCNILEERLDVGRTAPHHAAAQAAAKHNVGHLHLQLPLSADPLLQCWKACSPKR